MNDVTKSSVVSHFHNTGVITTDEANEVHAVVMAASGIVSEDDKATLFSLADKQTSEILDEFDSVECSAFVDYAFDHDWHERPELVDLFVKCWQVAAFGIANRLMAGQVILPENISKARNDWQAVACIVGQEIAYGSANCHVVKVNTVEPIPEMIRKCNKVSDSGISFVEEYHTTGYLVNDKYQCYANYDVDQIRLNLRTCKGSWIVITESVGNVDCYTLSARKVKGERYKTGKQTIDGKDIWRRDNEGIEPVFSFMRVLFGATINRFVTSALGGITTAHDEFAAETKDTRRSAGVRESDSDFDMVLDSVEFSEQEKTLVRALELTVLGDENYKATVDDIRELLIANAKQSIWAFKANYEGLANEAVHVRRFQRMVKNLKKHIRRFFRAMAAGVVAELPVAKLKEKFTILTDSVDNSGSLRHIGAGDYVLPSHPPIRKDFRVFWNEYLRSVNYCPRIVRSTHKEAVVDAETKHVLGSGIYVVAPSHKIGHSGTPCQPSGEFCSLLVKWSNDKDLRPNLSKWELTILDLMSTGV